MRTKDALRKRVGLLVKLGVTQKAIASAMGMSPAALSRWLNDEEVRISTDALDGFNAFALALGAATSDKETSQTPVVAGKPFRGTGTK
jgi:transcriptional regulator with XRE-family HTH domain